MEMIEGLQEFVGQNLSLLAPVEEAWQPTDYLPDLTARNWREQLAQFRESSQCLSNDLLVVLLGTGPESPTAGPYWSLDPFGRCVSRPSSCRFQSSACASPLPSLPRHP
jgi:hypothetical protein